MVLRILKPIKVNVKQKGFLFWGIFAVELQYTQNTVTQICLQDFRIQLFEDASPYVTPSVLNNENKKVRSDESCTKYVIIF